MATLYFVENFIEGTNRLAMTTANSGFTSPGPPGWTFSNAHIRFNGIILGGKCTATSGNCIGSPGPVGVERRPGLLAHPPVRRRGAEGRHKVHLFLRPVLFLFPPTHPPPHA